MVIFLAKSKSLRALATIGELARIGTHAEHTEKATWAKGNRYGLNEFTIEITQCNPYLCKAYRNEKRPYYSSVFNML